MEIPGYTYITHKLIQRPWGPECRFTVQDSDGQFIDEVIPVQSMEVTEEELSVLISERADRIKLSQQEQLFQMGEV